MRKWIIIMLSCIVFVAGADAAAPQPTPTQAGGPFAAGGPLANPFNLGIFEVEDGYLRDPAKALQELAEWEDNPYSNMLRGTDAILVSPNAYRDIVAYRSILEQPLSDIILEGHFNPSKPHLLDSSLYRPPLGTVIVFPKELEPGSKHYIHYLIGPLFNPEDGFLKPLILYNIEFVDPYRNYASINPAMDPGMKLKNLQVKLAIPEDKIYVHYDQIEIRELWNDQMEGIYQQVSNTFQTLYEVYLRTVETPETAMDETAYFNYIAKRLFLNIVLPSTRVPLNETNSLIGGIVTKPYMALKELAKAIDELTVLFVDIATSGVGELVKAWKISEFKELKELAENIMDAYSLAKTSVEAVTTLSESWKLLAGEHQENGTLFSDLQIMAYNENDYDVVSINWVDDVPYLLKGSYKKNNILITIPITVEKELDPREIVGNYISVNYKAPITEQRISQYFPWQQGPTQRLVDHLTDVHHFPYGGEMVLVEGGSFQMGNTRGDSEGNSDEKPVHTVNLTYDYLIGKYEVTNEEYVEFLNGAGVSSDGSYNGHEVIDMDDPDCEYSYQKRIVQNYNEKLEYDRRFEYDSGQGKNPVIAVTWWGAVEYCNWLSEKEGLAVAYDSEGNLLDSNGRPTTDIRQVKGYRLPTEAEWVYAARGGHKSAGDYKYAGSDELDEVGWYGENSDDQTHPVGTKKPNELGLYDMSGNVYEWCHDWKGSYGSSSQTNPTGPSQAGSSRVIRGGYWYDPYELFCRVAYRFSCDPSSSGSFLGLRLARTYSEKTEQSYSVNFQTDPKELGEEERLEVEEGATVTWEAEEFAGYEFRNWVIWEGDRWLTEASKQIEWQVTKDATIVAMYVKRNSHWIHFQTDPKELGEEERLEVEEGATVTRQAEEFAGYEFRNWVIWDGESWETHTERELRLEVDKDITITAVYDKIETHPYGGEMVLVEGGSFQMGDEVGDLWYWCRPVHTVELTYDYLIGKTEVTFDEYDAYCSATGKNKPDDWGWGRGNRPVINVSWLDAIGYCNWLSEKEGFSKAYDSDGNLLDSNGRQTRDITKVEGYRLPTEAEWEYAARGGNKSVRDYKYAGSDNLDEVGWFSDNSDTGDGRQTHPVGQKAANELGLYDMSGNVYEWCHDWWDEDWYEKGSQTNPVGPSQAGSDRVERGGVWFMIGARYCRMAFRYYYSPSDSLHYLGLRLARTY